MVEEKLDREFLGSLYLVFTYQEKLINLFINYTFFVIGVTTEMMMMPHL